MQCPDSRRTADSRAEQRHIKCRKKLLTKNASQRFAAKRPEQRKGRPATGRPFLSRENSSTGPKKTIRTSGEILLGGERQCQGFLENKCLCFQQLNQYANSVPEVTKMPFAGSKSHNGFPFQLLKGLLQIKPDDINIRWTVEKPVGVELVGHHPHPPKQIP